MNVTRLAKWISRLPRAQVVKIQAVYMSVQGDEPVHAWTLAELSTEEMRSEKDLTVDILETLQNDCDVREYQSRYSVRALDEKGEVVAATVCLSRPANSTDPAGVGDPSLGGIVSQTLRHNEALMRMVVNSVSGLLQAQHDILLMQAEQIKTLRRREKAQQETETDDVEKVARAESLLKVADAVSTEVIPRIARYLDAMPDPIQGQPS